MSGCLNLPVEGLPVLGERSCQRRSRDAGFSCNTVRHSWPQLHPPQCHECIISTSSSTHACIGYSSIVSLCKPGSSCEQKAVQCRQNKTLAREACRPVVENSSIRSAVLLSTVGTRRRTPGCGIMRYQSMCSELYQRNPANADQLHIPCLKATGPPRQVLMLQHGIRLGSALADCGLTPVDCLVYVARHLVCRPDHCCTLLSAV
jgi:hypothetical protein